MKRVILLRYAEIHLKGGNRGYFEKVLLTNTRNALKDYKCKIEKTGARFIVSDYESEYEQTIVSLCQKIFGFVTLSLGIEVATSKENIFDTCKEFDFNNCVFRVSVRRADKTFPIHSTEFSADVGEYILNNYSNAKVSLHDYEKELYIDIRENGKTYIFCDTLPCAKGMPLGTAGNAMCLLSGGIDSPVAIYKVAKRGAKIYTIHFHSYPYTSELAKQKVIDLAKRLCDYTGKIHAIFIPFTKVQESIHKHCDPKLMIAIMRRIMYRIAERMAKQFKCGALVTGESLGQVASQTMESIISSNSVVDLPIYRPLIGDDKDDIIEVARKINTFDISILPYEDCCTVFLPRNPVIKPDLEYVKAEESKLDLEELINYAIDNKEVMQIRKQ